MSKQIVRQGPYLRRYARALTGSQNIGDALVQATMERLLEGDLRLDTTIALRPALFRVLHQTWRASPHATPSGSDLQADLRLQTLSPAHRAALLLVAMEGFTAAEAALVVEVSLPELEERLAQAQAQIEGQLATQVLIIEDEPIIGLDLTRVVRELGHAVVGVAATRAEAVALARQTRPGLVLADVRLADGSNGMDAAQEILEGVDVPVIFITAFPEHLLTGERSEPAFLITKPFREDTVKALIGQALFFHTPPPGAGGLSSLDPASDDHMLEGRSRGATAAGFTLGASATQARGWALDRADAVRATIQTKPCLTVGVVLAGGVALGVSLGRALGRD